MLNLYTPFPRYENIIIVGDTAAEALATLRIWGRALVGGDIPGMEVLHPAEKMLECTHCAMRDRPKILDAAARRLGVDFILLEENGLPDLNPARMKADLEREGFTVKVLDVRGSAVEVLRRAGALMGEEKHAERMAGDWETRMAYLQELQAASPLPPLRILPVLGIRHPVEDQIYGFLATADSDLTRELMEPLGLVNVVGKRCGEVLPGTVETDMAVMAEIIRRERVDVIALCGDAAAAASLALPVLKEVGTVERPVLLPLPWHCRPMMWRLPRSMEVWYGTLKGI